MDGLRRFRYLSSSLLSSSLHVPYRITEFATYHNRVRYLYLDAKFKTCRGEVVGAITCRIPTPRRATIKTDSVQSSSNTCKNYLLKIYLKHTDFLNAI